MGSLIELPALGPEVNLACGGSVSAAKPRKVWYAGFAVWSCRKSPALAQKLQVPGL